MEDRGHDQHMEWAMAVLCEIKGEWEGNVSYWSKTKFLSMQYYLAFASLHFSYL